MLSFSKRDLGLLARFLVAHAVLKYHLHQFGKANAYRKVGQKTFLKTPHKLSLWTTPISSFCFCNLHKGTKSKRLVCSTRLQKINFNTNSRNSFRSSINVLFFALFSHLLAIFLLILLAHIDLLHTLLKMFYALNSHTNLVSFKSCSTHCS